MGAEPAGAAPPALLCGGLIGISVIVFGQLFHFLPCFPARQRALVFLTSFALFCAIVIVLVVLVVRFVHDSPSADVTLFDGDLPKGFFFPVPILSIKINNPSQDPPPLSEIVLHVRKRAVVPQEFPLVNDTIYADPDKQRGGIGIDNFGCGQKSSVSVKYQIVPMPPELLDRFSSHECCVPELSALATASGVNWDTTPFVTTFTEEQGFTNLENVKIQSFGAPLDKKALECCRNSKVAILYGVPNYNVEGVTKTLRMVCRVFYFYPGGQVASIHTTSTILL
jgi:hypothetical protein